MNSHAINNSDQAKVWLSAIPAKILSLDSTPLGQKLSSLARRVVSSEISEQFFSHPGSTHKHHAYPGGLCVHTAQVLLTAMVMASTLDVSNVERCYLLVGGLYHDLGKISTYEKVGDQYLSTPDADLLGHISIGLVLFGREALAVDLDSDSTTQILHLIASHHGFKEWGSPVVPATSIAWCLHSADVLSSQYTTDAHVTGPERRSTGL